MSNSIERLACFDELAKAREVAEPATKTVSKGAWRVTQETSKVDDSTTVTMILDADNTIEFSGHFMADLQSYGDVTIRVDKQKARVIQMTESTDNKVLGLWRGAGVPFLKQLLGKDTLLARATPYNQSAVTAEFRIEGIEGAIAPLRKVCSW